MTSLGLYVGLCGSLSSQKNAATAEYPVMFCTFLRTKWKKRKRKSAERKLGREEKSGDVVGQIDFEEKRKQENDLFKGRGRTCIYRFCSALYTENYRKNWCYRN